MTGLAYFRMVHFKPAPSRGDSFAVAGLVQFDGLVRVHLTPSPPGASCLGGTATERLLSRSLRHLSTHSSFDRLDGFGPYFHLGDPQPVAADRIDSVVHSLLANATLGVVHAEHEQAQGRRATARRWINHFGLRTLVQDNFRPGHGVGNFLRHAGALQRVSQYVLGTHSLLLLEPLVPRPQFAEDVKKVAQRLAAYRTALDGAEGPDTSLIAYALPGLSSRDVVLAHSALDFTGAEFVNTRPRQSRVGFIARIKEVGAETLLST